MAMRIPLFCAIWLMGIANAQDPDQALKLRGDRFPPIKYQDMTPAQKAMADRAIAGRGAIGDFNIVLRSPELASVLRAGPRAALSAKQSELAILIVARYWTTQFEWAVHHRVAVQAGLSEAIVSAIAEGRKPESLAPDEAAVYNFLEELFNTKQVSDATFAAAKSWIRRAGNHGSIWSSWLLPVGFVDDERRPLPHESRPNAGAEAAAAGPALDRNEHERGRTIPAAGSPTDDPATDGPDG